MQIVDAALAAVTKISGDWLACRKGCAQCCHGAFRINQLDVARLQAGMRELRRKDESRAAAVQQRTREWIKRNGAEFPGSMTTGILTRGSAADAAFEDFANDEPCPALDPETQACDLYAYRPMTCRVFGPPVQTEQGIGVCELCFQGAPAEEISRCELRPDPDNFEANLLSNLDSRQRNIETVVAFALLTPTRSVR